jgi:secreted trypsin-like serine protease
VNVTQRKSKQKKTIKRKKRRELYDGDIVDPVMPYASVSGGGEDEDSCQGDTGGPIFDQESTRSEW